MSIMCLYHKHCMDGKGAAAVVDRKHPGAKFFPMQYGDQLPIPLTDPDLHGVQLYIVDYSLPEHQMVKLGEACRKLIWLDHHKTAKELLPTLFKTPDWFEITPGKDFPTTGPAVSVRMEESGASLTWKILFPDKPMPEILKYIKDRDLWEWKLGFSREVSEALRVRFPADDFKGLLDLDPRDLVGEGKRFWDKKMRQVKRNSERAYPVEFNKKRAFAVNAYEHVSETGEYMLEHLTHNEMSCEVAIIYWKEKDKWIHSLRSKASVDVSEMAKKEGGGGLAQAAGFQLPALHPALIKGLNAGT